MGKVIAAIGKSYEEINHEALGLFFGEHKIISGGMALDNYNEEIVKQYMKKDEIQIIIDLVWEAVIIQFGLVIFTQIH